MSNADFFLYNISKPLPKFKVVGLIQSEQFQKCRYLLQKLHTSYPKQYAEPEIRAMLNLDWDLYLTKMKRRHGKPYYLLESPVAVYVDEELIGDDKVFMNIVHRTYRLDLDVDFADIAEKELIKYFEDFIEKYQRKFAFLTIAIDEHVVGSMLFMLYNDLVPITCANFLNRCTDSSPFYNYKGTKVYRIAKYSWIQCGGKRLRQTHMPCENYAVPHDRRGVLSTCNKTRHVHNTTDFFITLEKAPWMDYNYVAFGQLIQGSEILDLIEKISTKYQSPNRNIAITNCGEFTVCPAPDEEYTKQLNPPYKSLFYEEIIPDDVDSILSQTGLRDGKYFLKSDVKPYMPFSRYSLMFDTYLKELSTKESLEVCEHVEPPQAEPEEEVKQAENASLFKPSVPFYRKRNKFSLL